ncbi:MAG TPA: hypothetical protein DEQ61_23380 [Streptomyces sp.]|nr:hypothetical protein [Streptomyces sp.]
MPTSDLRHRDGSGAGAAQRPAAFGQFPTALRFSLRNQTRNRTPDETARLAELLVPPVLDIVVLPAQSTLGIGMKYDYE